jgi:hypothetical protein
VKTLLGILLNARDESGREMFNEYVHDEVITMFVTGREKSAVFAFLGSSFIGTAS